MGMIAISTCAFTDLSLEAALDRIAGLAAAAEVRCNGRHGLETAARRRAVAGSGLRCSLHAPETIAVWSASERLRHAAVEKHRQLIEACADAGIGCYLIHPDYSEQPVVRSSETYAALHRSFTDLHDLEEGYPVRIVVENMPGLAHTHFASPDLDLCGLGLALDVGHALVSGTLTAFLGAPEITHLHLHDNQGAMDSHLPVGRGSLPPNLLRLALDRCEGLCVLEHHCEANVRESLAFLSAIEPHREVA